MNVIDEVSIW